MKTIYLTAILAITIQAMVCGQTQGSLVTEKKDIHVTNKRILATLSPVKSSTQNSAAIKNGELNTEKKTQTSPLQTDVNQVAAQTSGYNKSLTTQFTIKDAIELLKQVEEMSFYEKELRAQAKSKSGNERIKLINIANDLQKQIEVVQIQASEIVGKISLETFNINKEQYNLLLNSVNGNSYLSEESKKLNREAETNMKLAKEMRQEAYAMPNNSSKLGTMNNAEEKENIALNKQNIAIEILKKSSTQSMIVTK